jgi:hypothetical protein
MGCTVIRVTLRHIETQRKESSHQLHLGAKEGLTEEEAIELGLDVKGFPGNTLSMED